MHSPFPFSSLVSWWRTYGRHDLPWRQVFGLADSERTYRVWLSEILLQQTQADRVVGFYGGILARYPSVEYLARETFEGFFPHYQGLGYYHRARNMLAAARIVTERHGGIFPRTYEELRALP